MRLRLAVGLVITVVAAFSAVAAQAGPAPLVITTAHTSLGTILTNGARTVYLSLADSSGHSRCTGSCAAVWPPVKATGPLKAAGGVKASLLGEIALHGGGKQVTYDHHPLYYFASDKQHSTSGEAVNGFYAVDVAGGKVVPAKAAPKSGW